MADLLDHHYDPAYGKSMSRNYRNIDRARLIEVEDVSPAGMGRLAAMLAGFLVTFVVRSLAFTFGWSLPVFRESSKRERWRIEPKESAGDETP